MRLLSLFTGRSAQPAPEPRTLVAARIDASIAQNLRARHAERAARPPKDEHKRFARARAKVDVLRHEIAMQMVVF